MDELFPSEIARLVLGYLKENKCEKSWKVFLEESSNLQEYCELYKKGKLYPTNVNGKSLLDILQEYCDFKKNAEKNVNNQLTEGTFKDRCKIILKDIVQDAAEHVLLKYFPSVSDKKHRKTDDSVDVTEAIQTSDLTTKRCIEYGNIDETENTNNDHTPEESSVNDVADVNVANQSNEESNSEVNRTSHKLSVTEVNGTSHKLSVIESSVSGTIYLQEIIKVEKDNDSVSENSPENNISNIKLSNSFSECNNDLNSLTKNSKIIAESQSDADSTSELSKNADKAISLKQTTDSMEVEIIETVKLEPNSNVSYENGTSTNFIQNSSVITSQDSRSTVEISQSPLCDTPNTIGQFSNLVNDIGFSTNQSGITFQSTSPFSNQPMFSSVPTYIVPNYSPNTPYLQNNAQYGFVINPSTTWDETAVTGLSLNLPNIQQNNMGPILTSVDSLNNGTSSIPAICINNTLNPALTPVKQIICSSNSSVPASSIKNFSNPSSTTGISTTTGQSFTVSSVPSNVSSSINTAATAHTKSNTKLKNKQISGKKTRGKKKDELFAESVAKIGEYLGQNSGKAASKEKVVKIGEILGQVQKSGKAASKKTKRNTLPDSSESKKKTRRRDK